MIMDIVPLVPLLVGFMAAKSLMLAIKEEQNNTPIKRKIASRLVYLIVLYRVYITGHMFSKMFFYKL